MSDTFREQLVTRYRAAALRVTKDELHDVLKEYDATAPDRERAAKALAVFEGAQFALKVMHDGGDGCVLCPVEIECDGVSCLACSIANVGKSEGILPEEAK